MDSAEVVQEPIVKKCEGCAYIQDGHCIPYIFPASKWRSGNCPLATHLTKKKETTEEKKNRVGQRKQRKQPKLSKKSQKTYSRLGQVE